MQHENTYCVIMAGGIGSRFWPMSRNHRPKQFLDILGTGRTLLQMTYDRFIDFIPPEQIVVVTNALYKDMVLEQLPDLDPEQVISEPSRKNTAPCVAYAAFRVGEKNPEASLLIAPSDHLITKEEAFRKTVSAAIDRSEASGSLVTLGVKPTQPATGYGYIQFTEASDASDPAIKKVLSFTEKPDKQTAEEFLRDGNYYWNSGLFIWTIPVIKEALRHHLPEMYGLFDSVKDRFHTSKEKEALESIYEKTPAISIDYGVMEKADNVEVVLGDLGWSDLGTWGALYDHLKKDGSENAFVGDHSITRDSFGNIVSSPEDKLVVLQGVKNKVVVESGDVLLICDRDQEQRIKDLVEEVRTREGDRFI